MTASWMAADGGAGTLRQVPWASEIMSALDGLGAADVTG
jgi:hypothetical protein